MSSTFQQGTPVTSIARRILLGTLVLLATLALAPLSCFQRALAMDALPDAHFVGFAQAVNNFGISSGRLALTRSANGIVRDYAARAVAEHTTAMQSLSKSRSDAGVSYYGKMGPDTANALAELSALQGPEFDAAFANMQVAVQTAAVHQFSAYSQSGTSGPLRRYAKLMLPTSKMFLEYAHRLAASR
jgi:predicted outer membrane protein